jgi:hypothetical protein
MQFSQEKNFQLGSINKITLEQPTKLKLGELAGL